MKPLPLALIPIAIFPLTLAFPSPEGTLQQWFVDLDGDPTTGYGGLGHDVLETVEGIYRQTQPPLYPGGWGPEIDCVPYGPNLKGLTEFYTSGHLTHWQTTYRRFSCEQFADVDFDGDIDLKDWWWDPSPLIATRMTGPNP